MSRSIIIEGADGHGKSTLVKRLAKDLHFKVETCGPHPDSKPKYLGFLFGQRMALTRGGVILDRHTPLSCYAYSRINPQPVSENAAIQHARITMMNCDAIIIFCKTTDPVIDPNKTYKSECYIDTVKRKNANIVSRYEELFGLLQVITVEYDWRTRDYDIFLKELKYAVNTS